MWKKNRGIGSTTRLSMPSPKTGWKSSSSRLWQRSPIASVVVTASSASRYDTKAIGHELLNDAKRVAALTHLLRELVCCPLRWAALHQDRVTQVDVVDGPCSEHAHKGSVGMYL